MAESAASPTGASLSPAFARDWVKTFVNAWNSRDPDRLTSLTAEDVRWEDPFIYPDGALEGKAELRRWLVYLWRAVPDLEFTMNGEPFLAVDGLRLGVLWRGSGTHSGPLDPPGFAATNARVEMVGFDVHEFRDGLLSRVVTVTDVNGLARQIGAAPPPGSAGEKAGVAAQRLMAWRQRRRP
jgi:steroid delta-isomerase-like uncharacterized protein